MCILSGYTAQIDICHSFNLYNLLFTCIRYFRVLAFSNQSNDNVSIVLCNLKNV